MSAVGSVTQWIRDVKQGDELALANLHSRYWPRLVKLARSKMRGAVLPDRDAEDVAQIAFLSVYRQIREHRSLNLENRHQFLAFLTHVIACRAINEIKHANAAKRGGGTVRHLSSLESAVPQRGEFRPDEDAALKDCYAFFVYSLPDRLVPFAELYLAGLSHHEIAERMGCVERTAQRKVAMIREHWNSLAHQALDD